MAISNLHYIPLLIFFLIPTTFIGTYIAAVLEGHVVPYFPYISDVGTLSPESCVFGQLIDMCTVLLCIAVYIRYCQVYQYCVEYEYPAKVFRLNKAGVWTGLISCFGLSVVANFQETNVFVVHIIGALLCFGMGTAYFWTQAVCSHYMHPTANTLGVARLRTVLALICTLFFFITAGCGITAHLKFHGNDPRKWSPSDGGWDWHIVSSASEWIMATCFCLFILSFSHEFGDITIQHPQLQLMRQRLQIEESTNDSQTS